jgi:hypothetical protein
MNDSLIRDVEFFKNRTDKMDSAGDVGDVLLGIIRDIPIDTVSSGSVKVVDNVDS